MEVLHVETGMELRLHTILIYFTSKGKTSVDLNFLLARFRMRISTSCLQDAQKKHVAECNFFHKSVPSKISDSSSEYGGHLEVARFWTSIQSNVQLLPSNSRFIAHI